MTIGNRINELRKARGYTQEYIAEQLGVSRQAVSKWEQDLSSPDTGNLIALSELLNTSVTYLATGNAEQLEDKDAYRQRLEELIDGRKTTGIGLLILSVITFFIPYFGWLIALILLIVGIVELCMARNFKDKLYLCGEPAKTKEPAPDPHPWICYTCGQENPSTVGYCTNCDTNRAWSEQKQLEKKEI